MSALDDHISYLRQVFEDWAAAEAMLQRRAREMNAADFDDNRERYDRSVREARDAIEKYLQSKVVRFGGHLDRHATALKKFSSVASYDKSAFIMTKYPDGDDDDSKKLQRVIDLVAENLETGGFKPRVAKDVKYHDSVWDNVELNALGSTLGVAVCESRYRPEFNPNVAMEWGWMRGMGRTVIFLVESQFKLRADVEGIIRETFDWEDVDGTIPVAVVNALKMLPSR